MFVISTRNFPPEVGGMQNLMGGLANALVNHGPVKVFADKTENFESQSVNQNSGQIAVEEMLNNHFENRVTELTQKNSELENEINSKTALITRQSSQISFCKDENNKLQSEISKNKQ